MHGNEIPPIILCTECINYSHKKGCCRLGLNEYMALLCEEFEFPEERIERSGKTNYNGGDSEGNQRPVPLCYPSEKCCQATLL